MKTGKEVENTLSSSESELESEFISRISLCAEKIGSVNALARAAGIPQGTIRPYFKGSEPKRPHLIALARAAGVSLDWLATGEGPMRAGEHISASADTGTRQRQPSTDEPNALIDGELFDIVIQSLREEGSGFESVKLDPYADRIVAIYNAVVHHPRSQWVPRARLQVARLAQMEIQRHIEFTQSRVGEQPMYKDLLDAQQKELQALAAKEARLLKEVERLGS